MWLVICGAIADQVFGHGPSGRGQRLPSLGDATETHLALAGVEVPAPGTAAGPTDRSAGRLVDQLQLGFGHDSVHTLTMPRWYDIELPTLVRATACHRKIGW
jgi:hypothetical protein